MQFNKDGDQVGFFDLFILCFYSLLASIGQKLYVFLHHFQLDYECTTEDVPITKIMLCKWVDWKSDLFSPEARQYTVSGISKRVSDEIVYMKHTVTSLDMCEEDLELFSFSAVTIICLNHQHYQLYEIAHHNSCKTAAGHHDFIGL